MLLGDKNERAVFIQAGKPLLQLVMAVGANRDPLLNATLCAGIERLGDRDPRFVR
jgi:hypothetical protein